MEWLRDLTARDSDVLMLGELNKGKVAGKRPADELDLAEGVHLKAKLLTAEQASSNG